jgi:hypothetical protein
MPKAAESLMETTLPADSAAAWLSLWPHAETEDVREWLGERGAYEVSRRLPGVRDLGSGPGQTAAWTRARRGGSDFTRSRPSALVAFRD